MKQILKSGVVLAALIAWGSSACFAETVHIIAEDDWYPYSAKFAEGPRGIAVDLVREAYAAEGVHVQFDVMNYDLGMEQVRRGEGIGCFDVSRTKELENSYYWHEEPLLSVRGDFYAAPDFKGQITRNADLAGKKLGLTQGYEYGDVIDQDKSLRKEYSKTDTILIRKLLAGRLDVIVLYERVAAYLFPKLRVGSKLRAVGIAASTDIYVCFSKKHRDGKKYCDVFSRGLRKIRQNGTYEKIMLVWDARLKATTPESSMAE